MTLHTFESPSPAATPRSGPGEARPTDPLSYRRERLRSWVHTEKFRTAQLPPICVHTGAPADEWLSVAAKSPIGAQWLLLLIGVFPLVLVRVLTVKRATGYLPISRAELTRIGREVLGVRKQRFRRLFRWLLVSVMVLSTVAGIVGVVLLVREKVEWEAHAAHLLSGTQRSWDQAAGVLPHTEEFGNSVHTWTMENDCIVDSVHYFEEQYRDSTTTICRPTRSGFTEGLTFDSGELWDVGPGGQTDTVDYDVYDGQVSLMATSYQLTSPLNVAAPVVAIGATAALVALIGGTVILFGGPKVPRVLPKVHLDRSGERLYLLANRRFLAAAQPQAPQMVIGPPAMPTQAGSMVYPAPLPGLPMPALPGPVAGAPLPTPHAIPPSQDPAVLPHVPPDQPIPPDPSGGEPGTKWWQ